MYFIGSKGALGAGDLSHSLNVQIPFGSASVAITLDPSRAVHIHQASLNLFLTVYMQCTLEEEDFGSWTFPPFQRGELVISMSALPFSVQSPKSDSLGLFESITSLRCLDSSATPGQMNPPKLN